eukprot:10843696-Lingulodinium_polyedra.AAC.1
MPPQPRPPRNLRHAGKRGPAAPSIAAPNPTRAHCPKRPLPGPVLKRRGARPKYPCNAQRPGAGWPAMPWAQPRSIGAAGSVATTGAT